MDIQNGSTITTKEHIMSDKECIKYRESTIHIQYIQWKAVNCDLLYMLIYRVSVPIGTSMKNAT